MSTLPTSSRLRSGAIAGAASSIIFMAVHQALISNIWGTWPVMIGAGALCGLCIAWTYGLLLREPAAGSWAAYNLTFVGMFVVLGAISELVFSPITTLTAVIEATGSPDELIGNALPMTALFTIAAPAFVVALFGRQWKRYLPVLLAVLVLVMTLGLNISIIGLVEIPGSSYYLVAELLVLTAALGLFYAVAFWALERHAMRTPPPS